MLKKAIAVLLVAVTIICAFSGCTIKEKSKKVEPKDFRITAYLICDSVLDMPKQKLMHINEVTDIILFGAITFDEQANITISDSLSKAIQRLEEIGLDNDKHLYVNMLGPDCQIETDDWNEQMADKAQRHSNAFANDEFPSKIKQVLEEYGVEGVFFDYEFTIKKKYWNDYNKFIVRLDKELGDDYKIGMALASWDAKQNASARRATDFVEIMSYDLWDEDGNHATMEIAEKDVKKFIRKGYDRSKLDLGVPFYARPTTKDAYWYDYASYYDKLDENGIMTDGETGLTFSFNNKELIAKKTLYALDKGLGGIMVWHWACDTEYGDDSSLFKAIYNVKIEHINR